MYIHYIIVMSFFKGYKHDILSVFKGYERDILSIFKGSRRIFVLVKKSGHRKCFFEISFLKVDTEDFKNGIEPFYLFIDLIQDDRRKSYNP